MHSYRPPRFTTNAYKLRVGSRQIDARQDRLTKEEDKLSLKVGQRTASRITTHDQAAAAPALLLVSLLIRQKLQMAPPTMSTRPVPLGASYGVELAPNPSRNLQTGKGSKNVTERACRMMALGDARPVHPASPTHHLFFPARRAIHPLHKVRGRPLKRNNTPSNVPNNRVRRQGASATDRDTSPAAVTPTKGGSPVDGRRPSRDKLEVCTESGWIR